MMDFVLTAYTGKGRRLKDEKLNGLIDRLDVREM